MQPRKWRLRLVTTTRVGILLLAIAHVGCFRSEPPKSPATDYLSYSRFTDPGDRVYMLEELPEDPIAIASIAQNLTVHHNLLPYHGVPKSQWPEIRSVWPPKVPDILEALEETGPGNISGERAVTDRVRGACMLESHLLAGMLRRRQIPVRLRAGYFKDVYTNEDHLVEFWEDVSREKGVAQQLLDEDPEEWLEVNHGHTRQQVEANKYVEHWVAEYWDTEQARWRLLDANTTFLSAMSGINVGYHLPRRHFEYAFESWKKMRTIREFNPDQYAEWPQDGRSHIRSQLLWDFYSLLNHDIAGYDKSEWSEDDALTAEREAYAFVKEKKYNELSSPEVEELDALADLLSQEPSIEDVISLYRTSPTLRISTIEADPYSFLQNDDE